MSSTFIKITV